MTYREVVTQSRKNKPLAKSRVALPLKTCTHGRRVRARQCRALAPLATRQASGAGRTGGRGPYVLAEDDHEDGARRSDEHSQGLAEGEALPPQRQGDAERYQRLRGLPGAPQHAIRQLDADQEPRLRAEEAQPAQAEEHETRLAPLAQSGERAALGLWARQQQAVPAGVVHHRHGPRRRVRAAARRLGGGGGGVAAARQSRVAGAAGEQRQRGAGLAHEREEQGIGPAEANLPHHAPCARHTTN
eukprot:scaffold3155_cov358-Prasinococcus_capsulatus_cf.AAC.6